MGFVAGPPLSGVSLSLFVNRERDLRELRQARGSNYALVGVRRVGKTSILNKLAEDLKKKHFVAYVDVSATTPTDERGFLEKYFREVTRAYVEASGDARLEHTVYEALSGSASALAELVKNVRISLFNELVTIWFEKKESKQVDLQLLLDKTIQYPEEIAKARKRRFIVILDEFQKLSSLGSDFLWALRARMQKTPAVDYIIAGSSVGTLASLLGDRKSAFYGFFLSKRIGGLEEKGAVQLLEQGFRDYGIKADAEAMKFALNKTSHLPFYLQSFGLAACNVCSEERKKALGLPEAEMAWKKMFELLYFHFKDMEREAGGGRRLLILKAIAGGNAAPSQIAQATSIKLSSLPFYLQQLVEEGFVEKKASSYELTDPVFKEWLTSQLP